MASEVENLLEPDKRASSTAPRLEGSGFHLDWPDTADSAREATLRRLRSLVPEADPVREDVHVSARSRLDPRSIDDEPAGLVYDSTIDDELLASVRSGRRSIRQLTFAARDLVLELEVSGASRLVGQVVPPQAAVVELRHREGTLAVTADELGCFHIPAVPDGPVSFRCRPAGADAASVATSWITL